MKKLLHRIALYAFHICVARPILLGLAGVRYRKRSRLPKGPCLVVANHNSHLDAAVLMTMFPLRRLPHVHPVAAADYFGSNWFRRAIAMLFMNGVPIQRRPARGEDPLAPAVKMLKAGETLVFFPEGSRGEAGVVAPFRRGVGMLVKETPGLLVVPVFLSGPERIWPRGEMVPVPLNIDAHIGKPRTYSIELEPKEIAEQVRHDVLALAPPEPPPPGRRPEPPIQFAVAGIDDGHRHAVCDALVERLGREGPTLGVSDTLTEADGGTTHEAAGPIPVQPLGLWLRLFTLAFGLHRRFRGDAFKGRVERAQVSEALTHGSDHRFAVLDGTLLLDLPALRLARTAGTKHALDEAGINRLLQYLLGQRPIPLSATWEMMRESPEIFLINTFELVRPPLPGMIVLLRESPEKVMERLRSTGASLTPRQRASELRRLQEAQAEVAQVLRRLHRVEVFDVDGETLAPHAVAEQALAAFRERPSEADTGT